MKRFARVAGSFYPKDPKKLTASLKQYCEPAEAKVAAPIIFAPHAGYVYSGAIAGEVYRRVNIPATVVLLCPNHTGRGKLISLWDKGSWETPLGEVAVDEAFAADLLKALGEKSGDTVAHQHEHANEVHVPFLQYLNPNVQIVPLVLGPLSPDECRHVGESVANVVKSRSEGSVLVVASTDMSHYISEEAAKKQDALALRELEKLSPQGLYETVIANDISMCGYIPTVSALFTAKKLGAKSATVLRYGNSGEASGDYASVVAYASGVIQ